MKKNIVRALLARGCRVTIVPWNTPARGHRGPARPDGILLSNGPGDPEDVPRGHRDWCAQLRGRYPIFGICLGPPDHFAGLRRQDLQAEIRPPRRQPPGQEPANRQNRDHLARTTPTPSIADSLDGHGAWSSRTSTCSTTRLRAWHARRTGCSRVQYHPESAPGPQDSGYLFDQFIQS